MRLVSKSAAHQQRAGTCAPDSLDHDEETEALHVHRQTTEDEEDEWQRAGDEAHGAQQSFKPPQRSPPWTAPFPGMPRTERTRASLVPTFNGLVLERPYEQLGVSEVVRRAGVCRSTFYEHFRDKNELLRSAVGVMLRPLAEAAGPNACEGREAVEAALHALLLERWTTDDPGGTAGGGLPNDLLAAQLTHLQLGLLRGWLTPRRPPLSVDALARAILVATRAVVDANRQTAAT